MTPGSTTATASHHPSSPARLHPIQNVYVMENHDEALRIWSRAGARDRVLVHIDAHHDTWWLGDDAGATAANFICPAIRQGLVREVRWVVPDGSFATPANRRSLINQIESLARGHSSKPGEIAVSDTCIATRVGGAPFSACTLGSLAAIDEPVLLDVDVDYFVIPHVSHNRTDAHTERPWLWPEEVVRGLASIDLRSDLATIAYSVNGCYTTLPWKYLGDELAARLRAPADLHAGFAAMRGAVERQAVGDTGRADSLFAAAAQLMPHSAAPHHHRALLDAARGQSARAQEHQRLALERDHTYRTGFSSLGPQFLWSRQYAQADAAFRHALVLNPADEHASVGMACVAARQGRWRDAMSWSHAALAISDEVLDAHRILGEAYARSGDLDRAAAHYERSLLLALHGHKPLSWHIVTAAEPGNVIDEDHCLVYIELARVHARRGQRAKALGYYRIPLATGEPGVRVRLEAAQLFARERRWVDARREAGLGLARIPQRARLHIRHAWRSWQRP